MSWSRTGRVLVSVLLAASTLVTLVTLAPRTAVAAARGTTRVSVSVADRTVRVGDFISLAGKVSPSAKGVALTVQRQIGHTWVGVARTRSATGGAFTAAVHAGRSPGLWRLRVVAVTAVSHVVQVRLVTAAYAVRVSAVAPATVGQPLVLTGQVSPRAKGSVTLQVLRKSVWVTVAKAGLTRASAFTLRWTQPVGHYTVRVVKASTATRAAGFGKRLSVTVVPLVAPAPPSITTAALPAATVGLPYSTTLSASGGVEPYTWSMPLGGLPAGLTLSAAGALVGTPSAAGSVTLSPSVTDAAGHAASRPLVLTVALSPAAGNTVAAWGFNTNGELGVGTTVHSDIALPVSGLTGVTAVAGGGAGGYARRFDGTVWSWGYNVYGELGNGTTTDSKVPVQVTGLSGVTAVAGGGYAGYALRSDGTVWAWGYGHYGQLGNGGTTDSLVPVQVSGLTGVVAISASLFSAYAVRSDGSAWAWGSNGVGQLGNGGGTNSPVPIRITALPPVKAMAAGDEDAYALLADGTVWDWGVNNLGQLGDGTTTDRPTPAAIPGLTGVTAIAAGLASGYALLTGGTEVAWGDNGQGQIGDGSMTDRHSPVAVAGLTGVTAIAATANVAGYALRFDGTVSAWGNNGKGAMGDGTEVNRPVPVTVNGLTGVLAIGGGTISGFGLAVVSG